MSRKRYVSLTGIQYTFPVKVAEKSVWVSLKGNENDYVTSNKDVQKAIEASDKFKKGLIGLVGGVKEEAVEPKKEIPEIPPVPPITPEVPPTEPIIPDPEVSPAGPDPEGETPPAESDKEDPKETVLESVEYPDVIDINGAVAVLRGEPYKVHHMSLKTPEAVLKQAVANKVVFPNWKHE